MPGSESGGLAGLPLMERKSVVRRFFGLAAALWLRGLPRTPETAFGTFAEMPFAGAEKGGTTLLPKAARPFSQLELCTAKGARW